jgi:hypothetical protein
MQVSSVWCWVELFKDDNGDITNLPHRNFHHRMQEAEIDEELGWHTPETVACTSWKALDEDT